MEIIGAQLEGCGVNWGLPSHETVIWDSGKYGST
jgi:hypothetical protein